MLYVQRFNAWLDQTGRRKAFLDRPPPSAAAVASSTTIHFVGPRRHRRAARHRWAKWGGARERSTSRTSSRFGRFLLETLRRAAEFYAELAEFVQWTKETLRDPVPTAGSWI